MTTRHILLWSVPLLWESNRTNEFAESAADVGDGLSKSASVLSAAGADINEAAGLFTGINEVLQDSSTSGSALKIITLRIRGMSGTLEELGEDVDDDVDSISKVQTKILNLTHGKVNIFDDAGEFRNIYDILKDIANVYDDLSSTEQANLLETIAGKFYQYVWKHAYRTHLIAGNA